MLPNCLVTRLNSRLIPRPPWYISLLSIIKFFIVSGNIFIMFLSLLIKMLILLIKLVKTIISFIIQLVNHHFLVLTTLFGLWVEIALMSAALSTLTQTQRI